MRFRGKIKKLKGAFSKFRKNKQKVKELAVSAKHRRTSNEDGRIRSSTKKKELMEY